MSRELQDRLDLREKQLAQCTRLMLKVANALEAYDDQAFPLMELKRELLDTRANAGLVKPETVWVLAKGNELYGVARETIVGVLSSKTKGLEARNRQAEETGCWWSLDEHELDPTELVMR